MRMSQAPGGKKGGKGPPKKNTNTDEDKAPTKAAEDKDETSSNNGDKKEVKEGNGDVVPKPPSAGVNIREVAGKVLALAQKGEWPAVEQTLKVLEKLVAAGGEDAVSVPMAGILDLVIYLFYFLHVDVIFGSLILRMCECVFEAVVIGIVDKDLTDDAQHRQTPK